MKLLIKGMFAGLIQVSFLSALLLIPAGTLNWPRAITFLVSHGLCVQAAIIALAKYSPASLEARFQPVVAKSQPKADRVITLFLMLTNLGFVVSIPIEVFHLRWFPAPPLWLSIVGAIACFAGMGTIMTALYQNAFAAPIVKDQSDRGQTLIVTGLYGIVRHPFYSGLLVYLAGLGLWLESFASLFVLPIVLGLLTARMIVEERSLREMFPEYTDYMKRARCRIVPGIW